MRRHPGLSARLLRRFRFAREQARAVEFHHERFDGAGYPDRLLGEEIPLAARILTVADTLDAITSDRPYRSARSIAEALEIIDANSGTQFCPRVVAALHAVLAHDPELRVTPQPAAL